MENENPYDVVVVGSGVAGLAAALAAREFGLSVLVVEKSTKIGGGTAGSFGALWVGNNPLAAVYGLIDRRQDVLDYARFLGGDQVDEEKLVTFIDRAPEAISFFTECGVPFRVIGGLVDHYYGKHPAAAAPGRSLETDLIDASFCYDRLYKLHNFPIHMTLEELIAWGGVANPSGWDNDLVETRRAHQVVGMGAALIAHLLKQYEARGGVVRCCEPAERLFVEDGQVRGIVTSRGEVIRAAGVVLATGGYESNQDLVRTYEGLPGWRSMFPESVTGDSLVMGGEVGAAIEIIHNNLAVFLGAEVPPVGDAPATLSLLGVTEFLCPHTIVVNRAGKRFADETYFQSLVPRLRDYVPLLHEYANLPCYFIFDEQFAKSFGFAGTAPGAGIPDWVSRAPALSELGNALHIDGSNLKATVDRFNGFVREGVDKDFGRGERLWSLARRESWKPETNDSNPSLGEILEPPFYGVELHPSAFCSAGLLTNGSAQTLSTRRVPILGLFAAGNAAAHTEYGVGYQAGCSISSGLTFGYLAAKKLRTDSARTRQSVGEKQ